MTSSVSSSTSSTSSTSTADSRTQLAGNLDMFLQLLTTQLQHQDPLSPMDSTEFTSQLVQYASVEQQININDNLEQLLAAQQNSTLGTAVSYLGAEVTGTSSALPLQDGKATYAYTVPSGATSVVVTITDSDGSTVYTGTGDATAGTHTATWDGTDSSGDQLDDGAYTIKVQSIDSSQTATTLQTAVTGTVTGVAQDSGSVVLMLGNVGISLDNVVEVTRSSDSTDSTTSSSTTDTTTDTNS